MKSANLSIEGAIWNWESSITTEKQAEYMTNERSEEQSETPQQSPRNTQMTTSFDSSLRTDYRVLGLFITVILLFIAAIGYTSNDYTLFETALLLTVALLSTVVPLAYTVFKQR